ncbi:MAG TPA: GNAT family protein [Longimicrobiales bacterium]|nr:GNAT family protein [Longimicrobiales bacterium]
MTSAVIRPFGAAGDYYAMIDYFHGASDELVVRMGVDRSRLPAREKWFETAWRDHQRAEDDPARERFFLAWILDGEIVGHSSINQIKWGERAFAHLHLWRSDLRKEGIGSEFFRQSISFYFDRFNLQMINVEPNADNVAPNRVLEKLGFRFLKKYRTTPGPVNFEQVVNQYEIDRASWEKLGAISAAAVAP